MNKQKYPNGSFVVLSEHAHIDMGLTDDRNKSIVLRTYESFDNGLVYCIKNGAKNIEIAGIKENELCPFIPLAKKISDLIDTLKLI